MVNKVSQDNWYSTEIQTELLPDTSPEWCVTRTGDVGEPVAGKWHCLTFHPRRWSQQVFAEHIPL